MTTDANAKLIVEAQEGPVGGAVSFVHAAALFTDPWTMRIFASPLGFCIIRTVAHKRIVMGSGTTLLIGVTGARFPRNSRSQSGLAPHPLALSRACLWIHRGRAVADNHTGLREQTVSSTIEGGQRR